MFVWGTKTLEDFEDLSNLTLTVEQWLSVSQLKEDAANGPDVDSGAIDFGPKKDFWSSIPKCNHFMGIAFERKTKGPRKAKIGNFNLSLVLCNQKIAWFQVSVHDPSLVAMQKALKHLPDDRFEVGHG